MKHYLVDTNVIIDYQSIRVFETVELDLLITIQ